MSTPGKHARVALFYSTILGASLNKGYLTKVLDAAKAKGQGFGKYSFIDADVFNGYADPSHDVALIEGTVPEGLADRIANAYKAIGKEVARTSGSFEDEFRRYEDKTAASNGVTADPPMSATDNVTADRTSPMAHVETDGRNDPRPWQGNTGTSLDGFGLPLATTDRPGEGSALAAQGAQVSARTAASAADAGGDPKAADRAEEAAKDAAERKRREEDEKAEAEQKARDEAAAKAKEDAEREEREEAEAAEAKKAEEAKRAEEAKKAGGSNSNKAK